MGETRVDLLHLLEDLRDAYAGSLEETILTEIVANSLDSGAAEIRLAADPAAATLDVVDDGRGMSRGELRRYHDLGASTKIRGRGIGFAGVGIKLGLLACEEVVTESRRGKTHVATTWRLASRHRAPWNWTAPPGLVGVRGTAVRLRLQNALSPLVDAGFLERTLRRHFQPLFETAFDRILVRVYPSGVSFVVNGRSLARGDVGPDAASLAVRVGRQRMPSAVGCLERAPAALPADEQGVAVSTRGKVIKRGWDWLGVSPAEPGSVDGLIEVPALTECLTLNKADFIKTGARGAIYLAYRKALQEAVTAQLAEWGETPASEVRRGPPRRLERDLQSVLDELADDFPLLATLVERRAGGQRRLPLGAAAGTAPAAGVVTLGATPGEEHTQPAAEPVPQGPAQPSPTEREREPHTSGTVVSGDPRGPKRPAHHGLRIQLESRPDDDQLGRLVESTVWVNTAHPAYARVTAVRADAYHVALTVAMALAPLTVEPAEAHAFVTAFLTRWGGTGGRNGRREKR